MGGAHLALDRGPWCECRAGFRRWPEQRQCRYAVRNDNLDQCLWVTESGFCSCLDAQAEARGKTTTLKREDETE